MRIGLGILLVFLFAWGIQAQDPRFIYIQSETKQPFFVKIDQTFLNSSETGYLIIPRLEKDYYTITIGFPGNRWPGQEASVSTRIPGSGYLLKMDGDSSWHLIQLQTEKIIAQREFLPVERLADTIAVGGEFARVLAAVVNDPSIARKIVLRSRPDEPLKALSETAGEAESKKIRVTANGMNEEIKTAAADSTTSSIRKLNEDSLVSGISFTYLDKTSKTADTVNAFIAVEEETEKVQPPAPPLPELPAEDSVAKDRRFINMQLQNPNARLDSGAVAPDDFVIREKKKDITANAESVISEKNTDPVQMRPEPGCKKTATEQDFFLLRKEMILRNNDAEMISTAVYRFKEMCFTTEQVKNLGVLFLGEEERVGFYQAVYPYVADLQNFRSLGDQLADPDIKGRFAAMLNK